MKCAVCNNPNLDKETRETKENQNIITYTGYLTCDNCGVVHTMIRECSTCKYYELVHREDYICVIKKEEAQGDNCCNAYEEEE